MPIFLIKHQTGGKAFSTVHTDEFTVIEIYLLIK